MAKGVANLKLQSYKDSKSPSFYVAGSQTFFVGGMLLPILKTGFGQPMSPVMVLGGFYVHIATPACAGVGANAMHPEGAPPVPVIDWVSMAVQSDGGTLFKVKPPWLTHFLGVIGFAPIPIPPL